MRIGNFAVNVFSSGEKWLEFANAHVKWVNTGLNIAPIRAKFKSSVLKKVSSYYNTAHCCWNKEQKTF